VSGPPPRAPGGGLGGGGGVGTRGAPDRGVGVGLAAAGRAVAPPLVLAEPDRLRAEQRAAEVVVLPLVPAAGLPADGTSATDLAGGLNGITDQACPGGFVGGPAASPGLRFGKKKGGGGPGGGGPGGGGRGGGPP
ncbi:hypothetical protein ACISSW_28915, partial [Escherichia coli]